MVCYGIFWSGQLHSLLKIYKSPNRPTNMYRFSSLHQKSNIHPSVGPSLPHFESCPRVIHSGGTKEGVRFPKLRPVKGTESNIFTCQLRAWQLFLKPLIRLSRFLSNTNHESGKFKFSRVNCVTIQLTVRAWSHEPGRLALPRWRLSRYYAPINVNPVGVGGKCGQGVGIWQILKFFYQIPQGGKRKVNQKCQKSPHPRGKI